MIPVKNDEKAVGLIVLAAGASKRMGKPKQLLPYLDSTLLQHSIKAALTSICSPVVVVLGAHVELIQPGISNLPVHIAENKDWEEGMASSIRCGLENILNLKKNIKSVVIILCDQPYVDANQINKLVEASNITHKSIVISEYEHAEGVPVLFTKEHFKELYRLKGKEGAKNLLKIHKDAVYKVPFPKGIVDIDTPEDYKNIIHP